MSRIIQYEILRENNESDLEDEVNSYIKKGWQPIGGINASYYGDVLGNGYDFQQAMVLEEK